MAINEKALKKWSPRLLAMPEKERKIVLARWDQIKSIRQPFDSRKAQLSLAYTMKSVKRINPQSIEQVVNNRGRILTIAELVKYRNKPIALAYILLTLSEELILSDTVRDIRNDENQSMLKTLCNRIMDRHHDLAISDLKVCIRMGFEGAFKTKIFDRLDGSIILSWIGEYKIRKTHVRRCAGNRKNVDTSKCVPAPKEFTEGTAALLEKMSPKNIKPSPTLYISLEDYCAGQGLDFVKHMEQLYEIWNGEYVKAKQDQFNLTGDDTFYPKDTYCKMREDLELARINKSL